MKWTKLKGLIILLVLLELSFLFLSFKAFSSKNVNHHTSNKLANNDFFAMYIENDSGDYEEYTSGNAWPSVSIYFLNTEKTGCVNQDGETLSNAYNFTRDTFILDTDQTAYCYLYFDLFPAENYCTERGITSLHDCLLISDSKTYDVEEAKKNIANKGDYSQSNASGIYKTTDEEGETYFYRGNIGNNYVKYAGYVWRIIRINGSGSIRLIYSGESTSATGEDVAIEQNMYTFPYHDPTFVGYKYGQDFIFMESENATEYKLFVDTEPRCFSKGYTKTSDGYFILDYSNESNYVCTTLASDYENIIQNYPYSIKHEVVEDKGGILYELLDYKGDEVINAKYHTYSSKDYESTLTNEFDSTIKTRVDFWYENNILNKKDANNQLWSDYLEDEIFCNDRSFISGTGYKVDTDTRYSAYDRLKSGNPSLNCNQAQDQFSVANGTLKYPIALLTADEAMLAGGKNVTDNTTFYLYTGATYWTMTPFVFRASFVYGYIGSISYSGSIYPMNYTADAGIRPVLNLKGSVRLVSGNGTAEHPYEIALN